MPDPFTIIIDTREQLPYEFEGNTVRKKLDTGDYSIVGFENQITVERKTKADMYGCIGKGRKRFIAELERMAEFDFAFIIIECTLKRFLTKPKHSSVNPLSAIGSLLTWEIRYGVRVKFASDREHGRALTQALLKKFWKENREGME